MSSTIRRIAAAALAVPLAVGLATSADAASKFSAKSSGSFASAYWSAEAELPSGEMQYTFGYVEAFGDRQVEVYGDVSTYTCPEGVILWEDEAGECTGTGGYFYGLPDVSLTLAKKSAGATLTGTVVLVDFESGSETTVPLDVTMVGSGPTFKTRNTFTYRDSDGLRYSFTSTNSGRQAEVSGSVGDFVITGDSQGSFGTYKQMEREVVR